MRELESFLWFGYSFALCMILIWLPSSTPTEDYPAFTIHLTLLLLVVPAAGLTLKVREHGGPRSLWWTLLAASIPPLLVYGSGLLPWSESSAHWSRMLILLCVVSLWAALFFLKEGVAE